MEGCVMDLLLLFAPRDLQTDIPDSDRKERKEIL